MDGQAALSSEQFLSPALVLDEIEELIVVSEAQGVGLVQGPGGGVAWQHKDLGGCCDRFDLGFHAKVQGAWGDFGAQGHDPVFQVAGHRTLFRVYDHVGFYALRCRPCTTLAYLEGAAYGALEQQQNLALGEDLKALGADPGPALWAQVQPPGTRFWPAQVYGLWVAPFHSLLRQALHICGPPPILQGSAELGKMDHAPESQSQGHGS